MSKYTFKPSVAAIILTLVAVLVFSGLSVWQVERANLKQQLVEEIQRMQEEAPLAVDADTSSLDSQRYRSAIVTGRYMRDDFLLIDNRSYNGKAGFQLIVPMKIAGDKKVVLVNLGWLAAGRNRLELPELVIPGGEVTVKGTLDILPPRPVIVNANVPNPEHEHLWIYVDRDVLAKQLGFNLYSMQLLQDPADEGIYLREWPAFDAKVGMHIGYAIHWAVFALAALFIFFWLNIRRNSND